MYLFYKFSQSTCLNIAIVVMPITCLFHFSDTCISNIVNSILVCYAGIECKQALFAYSVSG